MGEECIVGADLTRRERQILDVIYRLGEASASDIVEALPDQPANATVRTLLRILEGKGVVTHRRDGKRFVYRSAKSRESAAKSAFKHVIDVFFGGSVGDALATHLADPKAKLDPQQIQRLRDLIDQHESKGM
ncbi:MAG: BlaI/MecI/CopY family transcriptional regulator [Aureliella sp.]